MIVLNNKWKSLWNDTRYFVISGGRGSSKSFGVGTFTSLLSFEKGHKILFTRQTMKSAHLSIIPEFQEKIEPTSALSIAGCEGYIKNNPQAKNQKFLAIISGGNL